MKVGNESRNKLKHKSTSKNSGAPAEQEGDFTMPSIPLATGQAAQNT
jgi:hypothetical protein